MGKATGFMDYQRKSTSYEKPIKRIQNFDEFYTFLPEKERQKQGARCMDCGVPFCQSGVIFKGAVSGCPLHNLIPEWNDAIFRNNYQEAFERLKKTNNFPEFTSRVCPAPCEAACTCSLNGEAVTIKANERAIIHYGYKNNLLEPIIPKVRTDKRVAVIGSGPAGLAAADSLNQRGHNVTVYEREDRAGGLLMYGIPNMKLSKQIVLDKVDTLRKEGVEFRLGVNVGIDIKVDELLETFDKVILALGACKARDIKVKGREGKGIYFALDYLKSVTKSLLNSNFKDEKAINVKGKRVLVIGGGDTGNDCVGTAVRQGAKGIIQLEMLPQPPLKRNLDNPWPEWPRIYKTDYGQEESKFVFGEDPRKYKRTVKEFILDKNGNVNGAIIVSLTFDSGKMEQVAGSEEVISVDYVFIAAGFLGSEDYLINEIKVNRSDRDNIITNDYLTNVDNIYAAGDVKRGQSLVVWAIKEGREVAAAVDRVLMGYSNIH